MQDNNTTQPIVKPMFATPFYRALLDDQADLDLLGEFLMSRETEKYRHPDSPQIAHTSVCESRFDLFSWKESVVQMLKNRLYGQLMNYLCEVNGFDQTTLNALQFQSESWFHITRKGGYFQPHTHPLASVSMIYCVSTGDQDIESIHEQGRVLFFDPRTNASMYLDTANRHMSRTYSFDGMLFRLQSNEVCIFPSYLQHCVEPYLGESPRITVAANFKFALK